MWGHKILFGDTCSKDKQLWLGLLLHTT